MLASPKVQLVVEDFGGDAADVSRLIGLDPTAVGVAGAALLETAGEGASWIFEIALPQTEAVEGQALALLRFLEAHAAQIRLATARYPASIAIAVGDSEPAPDELSLLPLVVADIAKLGLGIRIHYMI